MKLIATMGDPNGIGLEVLFKSIDYLINHNFFVNYDVEFHIAGNSNVIGLYANEIKFDCKIVNDYLSIKNHNFQIHNVAEEYSIKFGHICSDAGKTAAQSLFYAANATLNNKFDALITLPISKESISSSDWNFPGQTEMLAYVCNIAKPLMILFHNNIRIGLATVHIPINDVAKQISTDRIIEITDIFNSSLINDFSIESPKIAILGLNPHTGENGKIGSEEIDIISPAIKACRNNKINAFGPFAADGFFGFGDYNNYDGILAMYHDQGLIPLKLLAKGDGVNFTAGLPIVRTSADHGTAFHIAGRNLANPDSTISAMISAYQIAISRLLNR